MGRTIAVASKGQRLLLQTKRLWTPHVRSSVAVDRAGKTGRDRGVATQAKSSGAVFLTDPDEAHAKTLENRANWYEAKWCAIDQPEWNPATFVRSTSVAPETKLITVEVEISRERVALLNAYKRVGQTASIRVNNGIEYKLTPANAPFPEDLNRQPLYIVRGDQSAYDVKIAVEATSVKAPLELLVAEKSCPDLYNIEEDTPIEVGPFQGPGLNLRGPAMAIYKYPTVVLFVEGEGIGTARALIEATSDIPNLSLEFREDVRMYYKAPNEDSFIFRDSFEDWKEKGCTVCTTTASFQDAFDDDATLIYEPEQTMAVVLTGGNEESEKSALEACKEAEIGFVLKDSEPAVETVYVKTGSGQV